MREIKFRGIDKKGVWHYGYLWKSPNNIFYIKEFISLSHAADFEVIKESIGQFTGLKNKNEKEIYEGDILQLNYGDKDRVVCEYLVYGNVSRFIMGGDEVIFTKSAEVIGNIYENPELLKEIK